MPKQCQYDGCKNNVFSHNFCRNHQMYRTDEKWLKSLQKQPKTQSKIKPVSEKQSKKLQDYEKSKREKKSELKAENKWFCIFCGIGFKDDDSIDCHHLFGRDGDLLVDKRYLSFAHTNCHIFKYHGSSYTVLSNQIWYSGFLERIKEIDIKLYEKELNKANK